MGSPVSAYHLRVAVPRLIVAIDGGHLARRDQGHGFPQVEGTLAIGRIEALEPIELCQGFGFQNLEEFTENPAGAGEQAGIIAKVYELPWDFAIRYEPQTDTEFVGTPQTTHQ